MGVVLKKILRLTKEGSTVVSHARIIHHDGVVVGTDFLGTEHQVGMEREKELRLGREIRAFGPIVLLPRQFL